MRIIIAAALATAALAAATANAGAAVPVRDREPVEGEFIVDGISDACGFPVTVGIDGTFSITVFVDKSGATTREVDTQPGTSLTYSTDSGTISIPFSGVLHVRYPEGIAVGAPAELTYTGNTGPYSALVPIGSGRVVLAGTVEAVDGPFAFTRFTQMLSATGNFRTQVDRICSVLAGG